MVISCSGRPFKYWHHSRVITALCAAKDPRRDLDGTQFPAMPPTPRWAAHHLRSPRLHERNPNRADGTQKDCMPPTPAHRYAVRLRKAAADLGRSRASKHKTPHGDIPGQRPHFTTFA